MSEFSESYHLRSERAEDAIELLRRAKLKGYVFQPVNGWVTFVAEQGVFEPDQRIVTAATHPLLHYVSAEDHEWSFALYEDTKLVSGYRYSWDDEVTVDHSNYSRAALEQYVPLAQLAHLDELERQLHPKDLDDHLGAEPSKLFAQVLGLEHFDWLSYDHMARDFDSSPEDHTDVAKVI